MTANLTGAAERRTGNIVEARDVLKSFGQTPALRGASLSVRPGEIVAVMGPSGSGKSPVSPDPRWPETIESFAAGR